MHFEAQLLGELEAVGPNIVVECLGADVLVVGVRGCSG